MDEPKRLGPDERLIRGDAPGEPLDLEGRTWSQAVTAEPRNHVSDQVRTYSLETAW